MPRRIIDQALCDRAELLARAHPLGAVADILKLHPSQITRMRKRGWKAATHKSMFRPRPSDFAFRSAEMTFAELAKHYRCGNTTLMRWFDEQPGRRPSWRGDALRKSPRRPKS